MLKLAIILGTIIASATISQAIAAEPATRLLAPGEQVIQVDVDALLNARAVTTLTNGKLVTWTMGIDGGGHGDGYLTMAAALHVGNKNPKALPDNPLIPASGLRPEMLLHYSNDDGVKNQTRTVENGEFTIPVPQHKYRMMFLAWTGAGGVTNLKFELNYAQGAPETRKISLPDYYFDVPANDPNFSYVVRDLAKWGPQNQMTEANHHNIHAVNVTPDPTRELTSIKVIKSGKTYLVFWAATGVTAGSQEASAPAINAAEASATAANTAATRAALSGEEVIQVDVDALLNARAVTTLTNGKLVTWTMGIDWHGRGDGYLTMAAALAVGNKNPKALPDNPLIPASGLRPEMLLHYSNDDGVKNQTRALEDGEFIIRVPQRKYRVMFLAFTSSEGATNLKCELNYAQHAETRNISIPDYYFDFPGNDPNFSYVVRDRAKWGPQNQMTEANHHNIHAVNVAPDPNRELTSIKVIKSGKTYLVFWAATGVTVGSQGAGAPVTKAVEASAAAVEYQGKPYGGVIQKIPGTIQAEAYDVAPGNVNGITFNYDGKSQRPKKTPWRTSEDSIGVSAFGKGHVTVTGEPLGEDNVYLGWNHSGEWWKTTVQVTEAGTYLIGGRFAAAGKGTKVELEFTPDLKTTIEVPTTAGRQPGEVYHVWKTSENLGQITLPAGTYVMKATIVLAAGVNLDYFTFTKKAAE